MDICTAGGVSPGNQPGNLIGHAVWVPPCTITALQVYCLDLAAQNQGMGFGIYNAAFQRLEFSPQQYVTALGPKRIALNAPLVIATPQLIYLCARVFAENVQTPAVYAGEDIALPAHTWDDTPLAWRVDYQSDWPTSLVYVRTTTTVKLWIGVD